MQFYEDMKLEVIAAIPMTEQEGDKPKAKQTEAAAKRGSLMTALNCVVWDTNGPGYLSEFNLDTAPANQKHPDMDDMWHPDATQQKTLEPVKVMPQKYIFMNSRCAVKREKKLQNSMFPSFLKKTKTTKQTSILIQIHLPRERSGNTLQVLETVLSEIVLSER